MWPGGLIGLGLLLLVVGIIVKAASILVTIGIILIVVGVILFIWYSFRPRGGAGRSGPY